MVEQRLQLPWRIAILAPAALLLLILASTLLSARSTGGLREGVFDTYARIAPRQPLESPQTAIIDIDQASLERVGPWPWPRTAIAGLVDAAQQGGAEAVVVTVPMEGRDPLSPEVVSRFWQSVEGSEPALRAIAQLPTNSAALAAASATGAPVALGLGASPASPTGWVRSDSQSAPWLVLGSSAERQYIALPAAPVFGDVDPGLSETAMLAISSLPTDPDGRFRRTPAFWSIDGDIAPAAGLSGLILKAGTATVTPADGELRPEGAPPSILGVGKDPLLLGPRGSVRFWPPRDLTVTTIPAWRALSGGENWTGPLAGRIVFIGESVTPGSALPTARGPLPVAALHALIAEQLTLGAVPYRPGWSGLAEAGLALLAGLIAIGAAFFLAPWRTAGIAALLTLAACLGGYFLFARTAILLDPLPMTMAALGGPFAVLLTHIVFTLMRGDTIQSRFHGSLSPETLRRLRRPGQDSLLRGIRREVVALSCGLRLPDWAMKRLENRPDDLLRFTASVNSTLRRTILAHGGAVDFGEDGRLFAYWNVPVAQEDAIERACACALKMIDDITTLTDKMDSAGLGTGVADSGADLGFADCRIEIGLASAPSFAGPIGRSDYDRYAVIGPAVRLASALRAEARHYGPAIITDDIIFDTLRHHYAFLDLDIFRTSPDGQVRTIYGLVGNPFLKASKAFRQLSDTQRELVLSWRDGDLARVTLQLQRLRGIPGVPDQYVHLYEERLQDARDRGERAKSPARLLAV